ncbi:MAG: GGDEF domain-containing protein [Lachnospiraceae bacterium]|nr:GGDEF domain-containing protein [Lachnospiraceae bacterium]
MQIRIIDHLNDITAIQKEKEKAESDAKRKARQIGQISKEAYRDPLTCVGSKMAYVKKSDEMKADIGRPGYKFAIVMVDVNFLKDVNDKFGHASGDEYLKGCCKVVCQIYKHSPVFRVAGDEFVAILTGEDFDNRYERLDTIRRSFTDS